MFVLWILVCLLLLSGISIDGFVPRHTTTKVTRGHPSTQKPGTEAQSRQRQQVNTELCSSATNRPEPPPARRLILKQNKGPKGATSSSSSNSNSVNKEQRDTTKATKRPPTEEIANDDSGTASSSPDESILAVDDEFRTAMKKFRKADASRKLLRYIEERTNTSTLDQFMAVYAFRTLQVGLT